MGRNGFDLPAHNRVADTCGGLPDVIPPDIDWATSNNLPSA
jgi:hypothetical protein